MRRVMQEILFPAKKKKKRLGVTLKTPPLQKHQETIGGKEVKKGRKDRKKT